MAPESQLDLNFQHTAFIQPQTTYLTIIRILIKPNPLYAAIHEVRLFGIKATLLIEY